MPIEYHSINNRSIHEIHVHVCIIVPYSTIFLKAINLMNFTVSLQNEWAASHVATCTCKLCLQSVNFIFHETKFSLIREIYISRKFLLYSMYNIQCSAYDGWR